MIRAFMVSPPPMGARLLRERYRLERPLARGAMGELWVARDLTLDRPVAVKIISAALGDSELSRTRFQREARAAARLRSPHVVPVFDHGEDRGLSFIVMELLEGEGLDARLRRIGRCSLGEAVWLTDQMARGLTVAHEAGVVHRDLKPANLFLARSADEEIVKILDFGIAKLAGFDGTTTMTGELVGSPFYMSPEQAEGVVELDHRSDLWAVGVILYFALTGRIVFEAPSLALALDRIRAAAVPPPSSILPALPRSLDAFFERALARGLDDRFESARALALAFAEAAGTGPEPLATERRNDTLATPPPELAETLVMPRDSSPVGAPSSLRSGERPSERDPWPALDDSSRTPEAEGARTHRGVARPIDEEILGALSGLGPRPHRQRRLVIATVAATAAIASMLGLAALRLGVADRAAPDPAQAPDHEPDPPPESGAISDGSGPARSEASEERSAEEASAAEPEPEVAAGARHDDLAAERKAKARRPAPAPAPPPTPAPAEGSPKRLELGY
jgi:eukaryotic-like serine/threonine-protein kinase